MQVQGVVEDVVFRNNENGFTIVKLLTDDGELTTTGKFPIIGVGEKVVLDGEFVVHSKYGFQFKAEYVKIFQPTGKDQIIKYLSSGLISGVGPVTATSIVEMFGEKTLEIIEHSPEELAKVKGVSLNKASVISATFNDIRKMQDAVIFLQKYDISINMAVKIYEKYKQDTEKILKKNPYKLVEDIDGIGFRSADKIAYKMGVEKDSEFRVRAGIIHVLSESAERTGSTVINQNELVLEVCKLLEIDIEIKKDSVDDMVAKLLIDGYIKEYINDEKEIFLGMSKYFKMEESIANKLVSLIYAWKGREIDIELKISEYEKQVGFSLHSAQKEAIKLSINNGIVVITGGPGTGKTTIINAINSILKSIGLRTILLAPTGRAAKKLQESTGEEAKTIHRAIDLNFKGAAFDKAFANNEIDKDAIIVDEASMIDVYVMSSLLKSIKSGSRLIIVGDKDQLPSVGAGNVLDDIIKSETVPVVMLTQIFRQANESLIIINAHKINLGEIPDLTSKNNDFFFSSKNDQQSALNEVVELASARLADYLNIETDKIQVIAPTKIGVVGVDNINKELQNKLNPKSSQKNEVELLNKLFRVGDRVMQTVNNYEQEWTRFNEKGKGVFNGDIGVVEEINPITSETTILFEDKRRSMYSIAELDEIVLSYAITVHKSQGSEFDAVVIPIFGGNPMLFNRNLLYTAVTRAKKLVVIVGTRESVYRMVRNDYSNKRNTLLKAFIKNQEEKYIKLFS